MFGFIGSLTPGKAIAIICGAVVMIAVWILNAVFTFSYGSEVIGPFLLAGQLGSDGSAILSGVVSLLFYDASYTVSFLVLLFACRSVWQYGVVTIQFTVCLLLSILASITSILLLSPLGEFVTESALLAARYVGYGGLIVGFVVNCVATIGYIVTSPDMAEKIRESVSQANLTADQERFNKQLQRQTRALAYDKVLAKIPELAQTQADGITANYLASLGIGEEVARPTAEPVPTPGANGGSPK